ncbi:MAG: PEGA domain-containing protein [Polyangiaceae bacterium]|nr:PEGA domain-containing protein [Polyangiaceae bacterium]
MPVATPADLPTVGQKRLAEVQAKSPKLSFAFPVNFPPNAQITVDGELYLPNQLTSPIFVDSGNHTIVVTAQGYSPKTSTVSASNTETTQVDIALGQPNVAPALTTAAPQPTQQPTATVQPPQPFSLGQFISQHRFSLITAGVAAGLAIGGIVVVAPVSPEFSAQVKKCNTPPAGLCTQEDFAHIHERANMANGLFVAAAAVGVATIPIFLFAEKGISSRSTTQVSFQMSPFGAGVTARY